MLSPSSTKVAILCRNIMLIHRNLLKSDAATAWENQQRQLSLGDCLRRARFGRYARVVPNGPVVRDPVPPASCARPPYADGTAPPPPPATTERKSPDDVDRMRLACRLARRMLNHLRQLTQVGTSTEELNEELWRQAVTVGAYPSPLNYRGFPRSICTSVNNVAVHGIPDNRPLLNGDIVTVDVTVYIDGFHGDCADTFQVGDVDKEGQSLVEAAYNCRDAGISVCGPGVPFSAIGTAVQAAADTAKVTVVPAFLGHGIGSYFHGPPDIYHFCNNYPGVMEEGMTFTVEPVVAQGSEEVLILEDGWTAVMLDDGRAAQAEHTILITKDGYEILTS